MNLSEHKTKFLSQSSIDFSNRIRKLHNYGFVKNGEKYILKFLIFVASISVYEIQTFSDNDFNGLFEAISERSKEYNLKHQ